jgi:hypothetical protein
MIWGVHSAGAHRSCVGWGFTEGFLVLRVSGALMRPDDPGYKRQNRAIKVSGSIFLSFRFSFTLTRDTRMAPARNAPRCGLLFGRGFPTMQIGMWKTRITTNKDNR